MGRHSAPDDSDEDVATAGIALVPDPELAGLIESHGRHSRGDDAGTDVDVEHTQRIAAVPELPSDAELTLNLTTITEPAPAEPVPLEPVPDEAAAKPDKQAAKAAKAQLKADRKAEKKAVKKADRAGHESETRADLRMLRQHPAVRAQAIAAVLASFLVYTLVIIAIGRTSSYVYWLWIPIVASGVLVGLVLDLAHRRAAKRADQPER
jgi:hypothetical protein